MASPAKQQAKRMTLAAFLDWNDGTDTRYELVDGQPVAMAPPSAAHSEIAAALVSALSRRLPAGCRSYVEAGIALPERDDAWYQADVAVSCTARLARERFLSAPVLVAEVLSPSTLAHDRGVKVTDYRNLPSVQDILLVSSTARWVEHWRRAGAVWHVLDLVGEATVRVEGLGVELPLAELYAGVVLDEPARAAEA